MAARNTQTLRARITADTSDFNKKVEGLQGRMKRVGDGLQRTGKRMAMRVTAPILGIGAAALKTAGDFESSMKRVEALTGATGKQFDELSDLAQELGRTTQFSASQAADGMGFLAQAGFETDEIMQALPGTLDLAAAGQLELAQAADIASNVLTGFGMEAKEIGRVNDVMAATSSNANTDVAQLGEAFSKVGPIAKAAGLEFEETNAVLGALGDAGIQGSEAGTTLRAAIASLESPTGAASDAIERLGLRTHDAQGELLPMADIIEQLEERGISAGDAMDLFGRRGGPGMAALVEQGADSLRALTGELEESGGTAKEMADKQMEGLNGAMARLKSALEGVGIAIAESGLIDFAANFAEKVSNLLQRLGEANPEMIRMGVIVAGVVAAAGPLLWIAGAIIGALGALISPLGLVVAGLVGLGAAFTAAYKKSETFRNVVNGVFRRIMDVVGPFISKWIEQLKALGDFFGITRTTVVDEVEEMSNKAVAEAVDMVQGMTDEMHRLSHEGEELSAETADRVVANVRQMRDDAIAAANEQADEQIQTARELGAELDTVTGEQVRDMVAHEEDKRDKTIHRNEVMAARVERITRKMQNASGEEHERLKERAVEAMEAQRDEVVTALADQEREALNVLSRLEAESGQISVDMAAKAIRESAKQRDETVKAAREEFRDRVDAINRMAEQSDEFTEEMRVNAIREAREMRDESIGAAEDTHDDVVGEIKGMREGVENEVNLQTGNVLSQWDKIKTWVAEDLKASAQWWKDRWGEITADVERARDGISNAWETTKENAAKFVAEIALKAKSMKDDWEEKIDSVVEFFDDLPGRILRAIGNVGDLLVSKGEDLLGGFGKGLRNAANRLPGVNLEAGGPGEGEMPGGSVINKLAGYMASTGVGHRVTSTLRPGDPGFHGKGRAVDFAGPTPGVNTPALRRIQRAWVPLAASGTLKELIGPNPALNFKNGRQFSYSPGTQRAHQNHVHTAMARGGTIREHVFGVGSSGRTYEFGERGPETVTPGAGGVDMRSVVAELQALRTELGRPNVTFESAGNVRDDAQVAKLALMR